MLRFALISLAALVGLIAIFLSQRSASDPIPPIPLIHGRNNTVLFLTDSANGLSNSHIATSFALLEHHPSIEVHYASYAKVAPEISRVSSAVKAKNPSTKPIIFHEMLKGPDFVTALFRTWKDVSGLIMPPGAPGIKKLVEDFEIAISPWEAEEYLAMYHEAAELIKKLDPGVVVLDALFRPAVDATRNMNRSRAFVSPNALSDVFAPMQPNGAMFWKYPVISSGLPFPIPWRLIPSNIYYQLQIIFRFFKTPSLNAKREYLIEKGVQNPISILESYSEDIPWLTMDFPGGGLPLTVVPPHVKFCGPMVLDIAPAEIQDAKLTAWLKRAPTMLINLGSATKYDEARARVMTKALLTVLKTTDTQVLWKFRKLGKYSDDFLKPVEQHIKTGRLRMEDWLNVDPVSLLHTGHIVASVHHGGANCYFEAIQAGIPHVILPMWVDLYNFAQTAEYLGVGVWPGKETAPIWEAEALSRGFLQVLAGETSVSMKEKARALGETARAYGGRDTAAQEIARLASGGVIDLGR